MIISWHDIHHAVNLFNKSIKKNQNLTLLVSNSIPRRKIANKNDWKRKEWRKIRGTRTSLQRKTTDTRAKSIQHGSMARITSPTRLSTVHLDRCVLESFRIKGRGQDEVCGRHDAPGVWIFEPVLGGRLYSRPWTFHSVNVLWYCVNGFVPLSTRDFLRSFQCVTTVYSRCLQEENYWNYCRISWDLSKILLYDI